MMVDGDVLAMADEGRPAEADGGTVTAAERHRDIDYLEREVNFLRPSTPFMRDHLRVIWTGFAAWALIVFGPVMLTAVAPGVMTTQIPALGFPLHYFLVAIGAPGGALLLSVWYARRRDALDRKYGIRHEDADEDGSGAGEDAVAADGGSAE